MKKKIFSIILSIAIIVSFMPMLSVDVVAKSKTKVTVSTQTSLNKALKNKKLKTLTINTKKKKLTIPKGTYKKVSLVVEAPKASITNKARFKKITIKKIAKNTWIESAKGNSLVFNASSGRVVLSKNASVKEIKVTKANSKIQLDIKGSVEKVIVAADGVNVEVANNTKVTVQIEDSKGNVMKPVKAGEKTSVSGHESGNANQPKDGDETNKKTNDGGTGGGSGAGSGSGSGTGTNTGSGSSTDSSSGPGGHADTDTENLKI